MEVMIPIIAISFSLGIPIIAILTHHQRQMAELLNKNQGADGEAMRQELGRLARENEELRRRVNGLEEAVVNAPLIRHEEGVLRG